MNEKPEILVMGCHSAGTGQAHVHKLPMPGESISAWGFQIIKDGGKASHKAMILAKYGCHAGFIGMMGTDHRSQIGVQWLLDYDVNLDGLILVDNYRIPEAASLMLLDDDGNNMIIMVESVKKHLTFQDACPIIERNPQAKFFITDFEIPVNCALEGLKLAKKMGMFTILNPSPMPEKDLGNLDYVDLISPNEVEARQMLCMTQNEGFAPLDLSARLSKKFNVPRIVITLGSDGAVYFDENESFYTPALNKKAVDPSGAGDCFISSFIYYNLICGKSIEESMNWANHAAGLSVAKAGSIDSFPTAEEVNHSVLSFNEYRAGMVM